MCKGDETKNLVAKMKRYVHLCERPGFCVKIKLFWLFFKTQYKVGSAFGARGLHYKKWNFPTK